MDKNHFSAKRLRASGEPISKAVSCWWQPTSERVSSLTQIATEQLRKGLSCSCRKGCTCEKCSKSNSPERKATALEYGSPEEKEAETKRLTTGRQSLPNLFSGERGPKHLMEVKPPVGVPHQPPKMSAKQKATAQGAEKYLQVQYKG